MSIATLADEEIRVTERGKPRSSHAPAIAETATRLQTRFHLAVDRIPELNQELVLLAEAPTEDKTKASSALDALVRFIPTETITLYVAALAAMPALQATFSWIDETNLYWTFAVLTPMLVVLIILGKRRSAGLAVLPPLRKWPWYTMFAATIAFLVWALAVPSSPYLTGEAGKVVAAFGAVLVSTFLTLLEPVFSAKAPAKA